MPSSNPTTPTKTADEILNRLDESTFCGLPERQRNESKAALHQAIADMVERVIGDDEPVLLAGYKERNNERANARQRAKAELDKFFGEGGES